MIADDSEFFHLVLGDDDDGGDDLEFLHLVLGDDDDGGDDLEFLHLVLQPFGGVETANGRYLRVADPASNEDQHTFHIAVTTFDISWDIFFLQTPVIKGLDTLHSFLTEERAKDVGCYETARTTLANYYTMALAKFFT